MNELAIRQRELPTLAPEEIKQYVDVIGDAIDALKAKRNAAGHLNADKTIIEEMDAQIREYSAMKLRAEMELGKKTSQIEKADNGGANQHRAKVLGADTSKPKSETLRDMGLSKQRASEYERLAKNEATVNQYIDKQLARGEVPTRRGPWTRYWTRFPSPGAPCRCRRISSSRARL